MLNMPLQKVPGIPGAWPLSSEVGWSHVGSPPNPNALGKTGSHYDHARAPSRKTIARSTGIINAGDAAEAVQWQTRRAMAGMVDINSFSSQSSQSAEGQIGLGVEEDMEEDQTEGVIE